MSGPPEDTRRSGAAPLVPVTLGSPRFRAVVGGGVRITDASFPGNTLVPFHAHERAVLTVVLDGGFSLTIGRHTHDCAAGTAFVEPEGEGHRNAIGREGAEVLVLEFDQPDRDDLLATWRRLFGSPRTFRDPALARTALELRRRLRAQRAAPLIEVESLAYEVLERAARQCAGRRGPRETNWLERVRDMLHADLTAAPSLTALAREVGVHRVHLGRAFRDRFGVSLGEYHRRLRVGWAETQLRAGAEPIGSIAQRAGFADHSHFTRVFKRIHGTTPEAWRRAAAPDVAQPHDPGC